MLKSLALIIPLAFLHAPAADAVSCEADTFASYLTLGSAGCTIGDKTFSGFTYASADVDAADVAVAPFSDGTNFGFVFGFSLTVASGDSDDILLGYNVATTDGVARITDVTASQVSLVTGVAVASVAETICVGGTLPLCSGGTLLELETFDFPGTDLDVLADQVVFAPVNFVSLLKDFDVVSLGGAVSDFASLSGVFNTVSQTVPEPGTVLLLGLGLVGVAAWSRKK